MSNIRVDVGYTIHDGSELKFRSPVSCSAITGLIVYYPGADGNTVSKVFNLSDAHGNNVGNIDHLFAENVVVKVILDVTTGMAFVQNADTNKYLESRINEAAPVNLLDNSYFAVSSHIVNQRGNAKHMVSSGYTIDRWRAYHIKGNLHVSTEYDGYLKVWAESSSDATFRQRIPKGILSEDKKYTFAYKNFEGNIVVNSTNPVKFENEYDSVGFYLTASQTLNLVWVALYEGEYTAETLPKYRPKGYGAELAECMRYYQRFGYHSYNNNKAITLYCATADTFYPLFSYHVPMRIENPTFKINGAASGETVTVRNPISGKSVTGTLGGWNNSYRDRLSTITIGGNTGEIGYCYEAGIEVFADL